MSKRIVLSGKQREVLLYLADGGALHRMLGLDAHCYSSHPRKRGWGPGVSYSTWFALYKRGWLHQIGKGDWRGDDWTISTAGRAELETKQTAEVLKGARHEAQD